MTSGIQNPAIKKKKEKKNITGVLTEITLIFVCWDKSKKESEKKRKRKICSPAEILKFMMVRKLEKLEKHAVNKNTIVSEIFQTANIFKNAGM